MTDLITREAHKMAMKVIKEFEGLRLRAYPDPASGGKPWTIGWGTTSYPDGTHVYPGDVIEEVFAEECLAHDMRAFEAGIQSHVTVALTDSQIASLVSFCYNLGLGAFYHSTLLKKLNEGDLVGAAGELPKWRMAGGHVMDGLVRRREWEQRLFLKGV